MKPSVSVCECVFFLSSFSKNKIVKSEAFIPCVPSFVVYFLHFAYGGIFLDLFFRFLRIYYLAESEILFEIFFGFSVLSRSSSSFRAVRLTLLDIFKFIFRARRVCVFFGGIYNLINLSNFAYESLCDIVKEAITKLCCVSRCLVKVFLE